MLTWIATQVGCRFWRPALRWLRLSDELHAMFCPSCDFDTEEEDRWTATE